MKSLLSPTLLLLVFSMAMPARAWEVEHPGPEGLLAQIRKQEFHCSTEQAQCEADLLAAIHSQALKTAEREINQTLPLLMQESLADASADVQPLPVEVRDYFSKLVPTDMLNQIGWVKRDADVFERRSFSAEALLIQEQLAYQSFTIAWNITIDLNTLPSVRPPRRNWFQTLFSLSPPPHAVTVHYIADVRAPQEWTAYQATQSRYQALIAISPELLQLSRNKQLMTFAHETQHALDYLSSTPEHFREQRNQPLELVTEAPHATWQAIEALSAQSNCSNIRDSLPALKRRYFSGLRLIGPLYFSSTEYSAFQIEARFARDALALDRATYVALRMPQDAIPLRELKQLLTAPNCALSDAQARELYPVPDFLPDYFGELFSSSQTSLQTHQ